jgi:uncharacterized protein
VISGYGPGWIAVNGESISQQRRGRLGGQRLAWHCDDFSDLGAGSLRQLASLDAELVIFGSGERIRFPRPEWLVAT